MGPTETYFLHFGGDLDVNCHEIQGNSRKLREIAGSEGGGVMVGFTWFFNFIAIFQPF